MTYPYICSCFGYCIGKKKNRFEWLSNFRKLETVIPLNKGAPKKWISPGLTPNEKSGKEVLSQKVRREFWEVFKNFLILKLFFWKLSILLFGVTTVFQVRELTLGYFIYSWPLLAFVDNCCSSVLIWGLKGIYIKSEENDVRIEFKPNKPWNSSF